MRSFMFASSIGDNDGVPAVADDVGTLKPNADPENHLKTDTDVSNTEGNVHNSPRTASSANGNESVSEPGSEDPGSARGNVRAASGDNGNESVSLRSTPGAFFVAGLARTPHNHNATPNAANETISEGEETHAIDGFLPQTRSQVPSEEQRAAIRRQLVAEAITLDDSAVRAVSSSTSNGSENNKNIDNAETFTKSTKCFLLGVGTLLLIAAIALGVVFGRETSSDGRQNSSRNNSSDEDERPGETVAKNVSVPEEQKQVELVPDLCFEGDAAAANKNRLLLARDIVSEITSDDTLDDIASPQWKALRWIACEDKISRPLFDGRNEETGTLATQTYGSVLGGNSGEAQVLRRYALATFHFSTTEGGPWTDDWFFTSSDKHECEWQKLYKRQNFIFGEYDMAGIVCIADRGNEPEQVSDEDLEKGIDDKELLYNRITLNDEKRIGTVSFNFRIENNLVGSIPSEIGHLVDVTWFGFEQQLGVIGSIPAAIGNMVNLEAFSILFMGPNFGGEIPASLFHMPNLEYLTISYTPGGMFFSSNQGDEPKGPTKLKLVSFPSANLKGQIPSSIGYLNSLERLILDGNELTGTIPDNLWDMKSINHFGVGDNKLNGTLSEAMGNASSLTVISLGNNHFTGSLPSSLGKLVSLKLLDVSFNQFTGAIPDSLSGMKSLERLSLHTNKMNGTLEALESLEHLEMLIIHTNQFSGTLPVGLFSNTTNDIFVDISNNNIKGSIPASFSEIDNLIYLGITNNDLNDNTVPNALCQANSVIVSDCESCGCCESCCDHSSDDPLCYFNIDSYKLFGLECNEWWEWCEAIFYDVLPVEDGNDSK